LIKKAKEAYEAEQTPWLERRALLGLMLLRCRIKNSCDLVITFHKKFLCSCCWNRMRFYNYHSGHASF
jgi:hypothetical protein